MDIETRRIAVIGGGAAGFFAAIAAAEVNPAARVALFELTAHPLAKVRVSGGGRCNVTHACFEPRELVKRYPRGARELLGPLHRFGPRETVAWFQARGVELKAEADGRMFPVTDDSGTIVECLRGAADRAGVKVYPAMGVRAVERAGGEAAGRVSEEAGRLNAGGVWRVTFTDGSVGDYERVIVATGGNRGSAGLTIAAAVGHTIEPPVPSLFTLHIDDARIRGLEGLAVPDVVTRVAGTKLRESGPLLITHWGMSGPAILKLSAWGARELAAMSYRGTLQVDWTGGRTVDQARADLLAARAEHPRRLIVNANPWAVPARLWERLVAAAGIGADRPWTGVSNASLQALAGQAAAGEFAVEGKSLNKEEFVTCGGVRLKEVDFKTMESRIAPGMFFAGEVLDVDGVTGGFNFQAAWTTGALAGRAAAEG